jgi:hypothetical protein
MTRRAARVTQTEVENVIKGVKAAGVRVAEVRILPDWTIVISSEPHRDADAAYGADVLDERLRGAGNGRN